MLHLRNFELENDFIQDKDNLVYPNVSYIAEKDILHYMKNKEYEFVDLGLPSGLKWAACNIGATKPEESGLYFAWGEDKGYVVTPEGDAYEGSYHAVITNADGSQTEKTFARNFSDYKYYDVATSAFTKYNATDGLTRLENEDDGCYLTENNMRMPTNDDFVELIVNTTSAWTTNYNGSGIKGCTLTSKTNGNSIFLPAVGAVGIGELIGLGYEGGFWSSTLSSSSVGEAAVFLFSSDDLGLMAGLRFGGAPLRAVRP